MFLILPVSDISAADLIHHQLKVQLNPTDAGISVTDIITFPSGTDTAKFSLRNSLIVNAVGAELTELKSSDNGRMRHYRLNRLSANGKVQLNYEGIIIAHGIAGPFDMPESVLNAENVYLDAGSGWLPQFESHPLLTFNLEVLAPKNWYIISQGKNGNEDDNKRIHTFIMPHPQDSIYLLGGPYQRYTKDHEGIELVVYLINADTDLAEQYLQASAHYISLYSDWVGHYPYDSFAVVENRWQTGYGMPSFTLLGSKVIRLPFILSTSLPHEILHNWWGNGVYVDFSKGNWSEGLTAYMSDHFTNEQRGKGKEYRRKALERYANFAAENGDFALINFRSRHDEASQAIGYSKALMLFHMLRNLSGDDTFNTNIQRFWQDYQFSYATFTDLIQQLYPHKDDNDMDATQDIEHFTKQWLNRAGAPEISLDYASVDDQDDGYLLSISISQKQKGPAYQLLLPLDVTFEDVQKQRENIFLTDKNTVFTIKVKQRPQGMMLDPDFDVFRLLHPNERPASIGRLFGAKKQLLVMPENSTSQQIKAWQGLAASWSRRYKNVELVFDKEVKKIPEDVSLWILGWNNTLLKDRHQYFSARHQTSSPQLFSQSLSENTVIIGEQKLHADNSAVILLDTDNSRPAMGFIGAHEPEVITSLARKLPHYSSYGLLVFELPDIKNVIKQHLPVRNSPMMWKSDL